jgi:hypothetical protein
MLYHWNNPQSLLHHVEMLPGRKQPEAVLYAPEGVDATRLQALRDQLTARGYVATADQFNDRPVLKLQRFGTREALFGVLSQLGVVQGEPVTQFTPLDKAAQKTKKEQFNEVMVPITGVGYLLGDAMMIISGLLRHDYAEAATGAIWGSSGAVLAGYGKSDADMQMGILYRKLGEHLKKEGIEVPRNERELLDALKRGNGLLTKTVEFLQHNSADIHHTVQALGGLTLVKAGINQRKDNPLKIFQGISVSAGQGLGLLPEREKPPVARPAAYGGGTTPMANPDDEEEAPAKPAPAITKNLPEEPDHRSALKRTVDWFNEKPMRYAGIGSGINNLFGIAGAVFFEKPKVEKRNNVLDAKHGLVPRIARMENELHDINALLKDPSHAPASPMSGSYFNELKALTREKLLEVQGKAMETLKGEKAALESLQKSVIKQGFQQPQVGELAGTVRGIHAWQVSVATAFVYLATNALYSLCSKNGTLNLEKLGHADDLYAAAANVAMHQPEEFRQPFVNRVATMLSHQESLHATADQIAARIQTKLDALGKNPWVMRLQPANENTPGAAKGIA